MAQQVGIDALCDLGFGRCRFHNLLDPPRGVRQVAIGFKKVSYRSIPEIGSQLVREFGQDRHVTAFSSLALGNENHRFIKEKILDPDIRKLRDPYTCLKECLDQETSVTLVAVSDLDEPLFFITGQSLN